MHDYSRIACLLVASSERPFAARAWLDEQLRTHWGCVWEPGTERERSPNDPAQRSWVVGSVVGGEPLLQTRPIVRDPSVAFLDDFLRAPSQSTVAGYRAQLAPTGLQPVAPARYARWACICLADEITEQWKNEPAQRSSFLASLPDFIVRHFGTPSDEEMLFIAFLASGMARSLVPFLGMGLALLAIKAVMSSSDGPPPPTNKDKKQNK